MAGPLIGVLAIQGAFKEHLNVLMKLGARTRTVRRPAELKGLDGLVIPGGESTTMQIVMDRVGLSQPLREAVLCGLPTLGTCAGLILMAETVTDGLEGQTGFGALPVSVRRNGYGAQLESFEADLEIAAIGEPSFPGVFIRAPRLEDAGGCEVLAEHDGCAVAVRRDRVMGLTFHPELTDDPRLHAAFMELTAG